MKNVFELNKKQSSTSSEEMTAQQVKALKSLALELESLQGMLADNSDPWVISHLAKAINDTNDVVDFLRAKINA